MCSCFWGAGEPEPSEMVWPTALLPHWTHSHRCWSLYEDPQLPAKVAYPGPECLPAPHTSTSRSRLGSCGLRRQTAHVRSLPAFLPPLREDRESLRVASGYREDVFSFSRVQANPAYLLQALSPEPQKEDSWAGRIFGDSSQDLFCAVCKQVRARMGTSVSQGPHYSYVCFLNWLVCLGA